MYRERIETKAGRLTYREARRLEEARDRLSDARRIGNRALETETLSTVAIRRDALVELSWRWREEEPHEASIICHPVTMEVSRALFNAWET